MYVTVLCKSWSLFCLHQKWLQ